MEGLKMTINLQLIIFLILDGLSTDHLKSESKKAAIDRPNTDQIIQHKLPGRKEIAISASNLLRLSAIA
ncbi:hypothetical protein SDJN02_06181, partial [Cucurbita argyrosperma subsp. argyrosperma]